MAIEKLKINYKPPKENLDQSTN